MNATDFIKEHGLEHAKEQCAIHGWKNTSWWIQVKNLIQSHELVEKHGGLPEAKKYNDKLCDDNAYFSTIESNRYGHKLWQAIKDVEACQGAAQ